jgi:hypothetical protein
MTPDLELAAIQGWESACRIIIIFYYYLRQRKRTLCRARVAAFGSRWGCVSRFCFFSAAAAAAELPVFLSHSLFALGLARRT